MSGVMIPSVTPEDWKENIAEICRDMGVKKIDEEALNLLCLVAQQDTCELLKSCISISKVSSMTQITTATARVACHAYNTTSFVHPQLYETKFEKLAEAVNAVPLLKENFENFELCTHMNLSSSAWKICDK